MHRPESPTSDTSAHVRTLSMRALFALGGGGVAIALLLAFSFFHRAIWSVAEERVALAAYHGDLDERAQEHVARVLAADVALRQARAAGATPDVAVAAADALRVAMSPDDRAAAAEVLDALSAADASWRAAASAASAPGAGAADLEVLRVRDRAVVDAVTSVRAALDARERHAVAQLDDRAARHFALGLAAAALAALIGGVFLALVLRQTVRPMAALARHAESSTPVPDDATLWVTEVRQLSGALRRLQTQIHERQQSVEQSRARAVQLSRFAELVQGTERPHEIRTAVATMLEGALPHGEVQIVEWDDARTRLQRTWPQAADGSRADVALDASTCPAIRRKRSVRGDAASETACDCPFGVPDSGTYACMPMVNAGSPSGLVNIRTQRAAAWTRADVVGAQAYVNFASSALGTIYVLESTKDRALRDGLTGAYNRRFLDEYLSKRLADAVRHHQSLTVLLIDLDHFKTLNDTFGHAIGDRALVEFAAMVHGQIRTADAFVRYGGEEFVLVLSSTDLDGALIVAERIRARAERIALEVPADIATAAAGARPRVSASIGVATVGEHGSSVPELLAAADRAVYRAKARGRNRVEIAEPMTPSIAALAAVP